MKEKVAGLTAAMLALAFLTIAAVTEHQSTPAGLIPLTRNEIAHVTATVIAPPEKDTVLRWSSHRPRAAVIRRMRLSQ